MTVTTGAMSSYEAMARRMDNADRAFAELLTEIAGIDAGMAEKVTRFYLRHRLAKRDVGIGRISVVHGAYLDRRAIRNAAKMVETETTKGA